jgi:hypothetical protein
MESMRNARIPPELPIITFLVNSIRNPPGFPGMYQECFILLSNQDFTRNSPGIPSNVSVMDC